MIVVFLETYGSRPTRHAWPGSIARGAFFNADGGMAVYSGHLHRDEFCATSLKSSSTRSAPARGNTK